MTDTTPLFVDITLNGKPARVSRIFAFTPARGQRTPANTQHGFRVKRGAIVDQHLFATREVAEQERAKLVDPPVAQDDSTFDGDLLHKLVEELLHQTGCTEAEVHVDGATVTIDLDGGIFNLATFTEDDATAYLDARRAA